MYKNNAGKSRLKYTNMIAQLETTMSNAEARHALETSRKPVDAMLGLEHAIIEICSHSSLERHDVKTKSWDQFKIDDEAIESYARAVRAWTPEEDFGLFLHGKPGCAKTHMLKALIIEHCSSSRRWKFLSVADFMSRVKAFGDIDTANFINSLTNEYYGIVLDDLGTEKASDFEQQELFRLLEGRARQGKPIFMTSNLTLDELEKKYHARIVSRLKEHMVFIEVKNSDYRQKIHSTNINMYREKVRILPRNGR